MTQTSLTGLLAQAYDLHAAIAAHMETVQNNDGPVQPDEWNELHIAMQAANIAAAQLHAMVGRQRAADQPIPYVLAEPPHGEPGHSYSNMTCDDCASVEVPF